MNKDTNILLIRQIILKYFSDSELKLFGSRSTNNFSVLSDYDVIVITPEKFALDKIRDYKSKIRKELAVYMIPIDIVVVSEKELPSISMLTNHIINEALSKGISI